MATSRKMLFEEKDLKDGAWEMGVALPFKNTDFGIFEKRTSLQSVVATAAYPGESIFVYGDTANEMGIRPGDLMWIGPSTSNLSGGIYNGKIMNVYIGTLSYDSTTDLTEISFHLDPADYFTGNEWVDGDPVVFRSMAFGWDYEGIYSYLSTNRIRYDLFDGTLTDYRTPFNITSSNNDRFERADPLFNRRKFSQRLIRFGELCADRSRGFCKYCVGSYPSRNGGSTIWGKCGNPNQAFNDGDYSGCNIAIDANESQYGKQCKGDPSITGSVADCCDAYNKGYTNEILDEVGIKQSFIKENKSALNELTNAVLRISTWFRLIPEKDFDEDSSLAGLKIKLYNYFNTALTGTNENIEIKTRMFNSGTPNYLLSSIMPVRGYANEEYEDLDENNSMKAYSTYTYGSITLHPLSSLIKILLYGQEGKPCRAKCDIQYFITEHAKGTSQEANGYFKTNTTPDVKKEDIKILDKTENEVELGSGKIKNFNVQGSNEKFQIKATWSSEDEQFIKDIKVLENWSKKGFPIVLRTQQFNIIPPVLFTRIEVDEKIEKDSPGLNRYTVTITFNEI